MGGIAGGEEWERGRFKYAAALPAAARIGYNRSSIRRGVRPAAIESRGAPTRWWRRVLEATRPRL